MAKVIHVLLVGKTQELKNYDERLSAALMWLFLSAWVVCFYHLLARSLKPVLRYLYLFEFALEMQQLKKKHLILMMLAGATAG